MNSGARLSLIGTGIVAALCVLALIVFASTFDLNDYKERIETTVLKETGRKIRFDGDLKLEFFPNLGVELGHVQLSNAAGFNESPMIEAASARVGVRLFPLFKGDVKFGHLELNGLVLNLSRNSDGVANWDDLVGREQVAEIAADTKGATPFSLEIEGVSVKDASLFWDDRVSDSTFILRGVNLETGKIYKGAPFPVKASLEFSCSNPDAKGTLQFSGESSIDFENREYAHMNMKLSANAEGKAVPGGQGSADMVLQFAVLDFNKEHAQVTGLEVTTYGGTVHMDGTFDGITNGIKKMVATVTVDPFDAKQSLKALGLATPETADPAALTKVGGMAELAYAPGSVHLKEFQVDLDGSRIVGEAKRDVIDGDPAVFARLDVGELDLDRYLPPDHEQKTRESKAAVEAGQKTERILDTALLRRLQLDLEAKVAKLRVRGGWLEKIKVVAKARQGLIRLSPLSANLYGGSLSSGMTLNAMGKYPKMDVIAGLDKVDIGALSKDVLGKETYAGILNFNTAFSCQGERVPSMLRSMNGKVGFHLADGVFPGVNLVRMAKDTHADEDKKGTVEAAKTDSTKFGSIAGTGIITAGVLRNRDLEVKAPGLRADGNGAVVLPTRQIDYLLKVKLVPTNEGQGGKSSKDMFGVMVPIRVSGSLDNPRYWVSVTEYVKSLGGAVIGTAGSLIGGVKDAIVGVGKAVDESCCGDETSTKDTGSKQEAEPEKKGWLFGIF